MSCQLSAIACSCPLSRLDMYGNGYVLPLCKIKSAPDLCLKKKVGQLCKHSALDRCLSLLSDGYDSVVTAGTSDQSCSVSHSEPSVCVLPLLQLHSQCTTTQLVLQTSCNPGN
eukprot:752435-Hanusia_phi.AAC.2